MAYPSANRRSSRRTRCPSMRGICSSGSYVGRSTMTSAPAAQPCSAAAHATQFARLVPPDTVNTWSTCDAVPRGDRLAERRVPVPDGKLRDQV